MGQRVDLGLPHSLHPQRCPGRILVVDDDPAFTTLLATVLSYEGFSVEVALTGMEALARAPGFRPELVLLDVVLPDMAGFDLHRALLADGLSAPVLYITARGSKVDRARGMSLGADGYVTKPFVLEELVERIRVLLRPEAGEDMLVFADLELDARTDVARRAGREISLTPTEARLLRFLMRTPRRVLTEARILEHVWRPGFDGPAAVVETYVGRVRRKIDFMEPRLIHTIRGVGYSLRLPRMQPEPAALGSPEEG